MLHNAAFRRFVPLLGAVLIAVPFATPSSAADDVSQSRAVPGFERIRLKGAFTAEIEAGARETRVTVTASPALLRRVTTEVHAGTLVVGIRSGNESFRHAPKLEIALPVLRSFVLEGAGGTKIAGLGGGDVHLENAGAGSIIASGRAARETIALNGAGKIDATAVAARDVTVDNNGFGSVRVRGSGTLVLNVNGVGEIRYTGDPTHVESHVNGIGSISRL